VVRGGCQCALAVCLAVYLHTAAAGETMRVRVAWGGGAEQVWQGRIAVSEGALSEPRCLGIEADEPGSMWSDAGRLLFRQRSPRTYDGVDLLITAPLDAKLLVEVGPVNGPGQPTRVEISLANLVEGIHNTDLDDRGNRLLIRRMVDDKLRVTLKHDSLVFTPGETLRFALEPHLLEPDRQNKVRITIALVAARTSQDLRRPEEFVLSVGEPVSIEREVRLPEQEGIYDLVITATNAPVLRLPQASRVPIGWNKPLAQRKIQLLVLRPESPAMPAQTLVPPGSLVEIDPTSSKWWERLGKLPQWHRANWLWKGPLGNGHVSVVRHPTLGPVVQLTAPRDKGDVPWEAYTLPIDEPGQPYILEVDYPSDVPQTMGISIVEPNAAGAVLPIGIDSGIDQAEEVTGMIGPPQWNRHRLIFWPRTKAPLVLITNRRDREPAVYGKLRVYAVGEHLPRAFPGQGQPERLLAAYLDRPLFPENFSASEAQGPMSDLGVDDWVTFYEGGTRLVEYLNYVGFNGLMVGVLADGSTIYPSQLLEPTPRYDTGVFFETGQDPMRKDVLEMLLRLFDRERLQLIPALEFGAPLPQLEALVRRGGPEVVGLQWIGPEGQTWQEAYPPQRGMAPYYNVLDPRVQEAMLAVVHELAARYGRHPSFGGLSLQLSAYGYAQLPGPDWGLDDATIARFEQMTRIRVPGEGPGRFAERARFLTGERAGEWLEWRADQLSRFYRRVQAEVTAARPGTRLYLAGAHLFGGQENERLLQPALSKRLSMTESLLRMGIDARRYGSTKEIVLLRPERIAPRWSLGAQAVNLEIKQMPDVDRYFQELPEQGSLFFHKPQEIRLASFDAKSPFKPTYTWLATQAVPAGAQNRRRFVHSLATLDAQAIFDGGWELPLGQEDALRRLVAVYRRLPAIRFQRLTDQPGTSSTQPVTIRYGTSGSSTYVYLVNDAPFASTVRLELAAGATCRLEELSGLREVPPLAPGSGGNTSWTVELGAYDLVGVRLSAPDVRLARAQVSWPNEVQAALEARIGELGNRAAVLRPDFLRSRPLWDVLQNPGFERPVGTNGQIPGWAASRQLGVTIGLDTREKREGLGAVRLATQGPVATLISEPFDPPSTGRVTISVWLRGANVAQQPPVRVSLVGKREGQDFFCFAYLSGNQAPRAFFGADWGAKPVSVPVNDLPLEGLSRLQLRFDLLGPGEIWIDDVQLSNLEFDKKEWPQLLKLIAPADAKLQRGDVGDCLGLLEGYWPQFLMTHVPMEQNPVSQVPAGSRPPASRPQKEPPHTPGIIDRMRKYVPDRWRF
jgi:hypothetical protein